MRLFFNDSPAPQLPQLRPHDELGALQHNALPPQRGCDIARARRRRRVAAASAAPPHRRCAARPPRDRRRQLRPAEGAVLGQPPKRRGR